MSKKILSLLLALTLIFGVLPVSAFAGEPNTETETDIIDIVDTTGDPIVDTIDPTTTPITTTPANGGGLILVDSGEGCSCDSFCSDPDCVICKDDAALCFYYGCICEAICVEGEANTACPVCKDDYSKCVQAVEVPEIAPMTAPITSATVSSFADLNTKIEEFNHFSNTNDYIITIDTPITVDNDFDTIAKNGLTFTLKCNLVVTSKITRGNSYISNLFKVGPGSTLILKDIAIDGNGPSTPNVTSALVLVQNTGTLIMEDGATLSNNTLTSTNSGGGVNVAIGGTFNMTGGTISGNTAGNVGGGVYNNGTFLMEDGTISDNEAAGSGNGGGVYNNGAFTMNDGIISNNEAAGGGGGVEVASSKTFTMSGGTISGNTANIGGGVDNFGTFTMNGIASITTGNTANTDGGGVFNFGTFTMGGTASITGNTAGNNGGGVYVSRSAPAFNIKDSAQVTGGVYLDGGTSGGSAKITITGSLSATASIGIEGMGVTDPGTIVATGAGSGDVSKFYISNAAGTIGTNNGFVLNGSNIVLGTAAPPPPPPAPSGGGSSPAPAPAPVIAPLDDKSSGTLSTAINTAANAANSDGKILDVKLKNVSNFTKDNAAAIIKKAKELGKKAAVSSDIMSEDGKFVEVRVTLDPELIKKMVRLDGYTRQSQTQVTESKFKRHFSNQVMVVTLGQEQSFGQTATVSLKLSPDKFDSINNLFFYSYDKKTNKFIRIERQSNHWIDKNGYLHFATELGGDIIISNGPLDKK